MELKKGLASQSEALYSRLGSFGAPNVPFRTPIGAKPWAKRANRPFWGTHRRSALKSYGTSRRRTTSFSGMDVARAICR